MAQLNFDATQVEPDTGFDTVPPGWYNTAMDESDLKPTKDGAGTYLKCRFNILDGQYKGRKIFTNLNIRNANAQAQEIALRQLSAIGHAVGVLHIADSQQLHGIPLKIKVKIRKGDDQYEDQNEIISYKNINEPVETVGSGNPAGGPPAGFTPPAQGFQPQQQGFQPPAQQPPVQQQPPAQQFQPPAQQQQPWQQAPMQTVAPQQDPSNPFGGQPQQPPAQQPVQEQPPQQFQQQQPPAQQNQPWNGGAPQQQAPAQQGQQQAPDPHAAAAATAQQQPPPWANQG